MMRGDGGQGGNGGADKKLDSGNLLEVDLSGFSDGDGGGGGGRGGGCHSVRRVQRQFQRFWPEQLEGWKCY